jgi:CRP/FNR family cyclic AMP-dependent transcriptional regulator
MRIERKAEAFGWDQDDRECDMGLEQEVAILKKIPLFARIDPTKLKLMAFASERMIFKPGQAVCRQGDVGDSAFIIIDGEADILIESDGGPIKVASVGRNDIIGEIAILLDVPRTATVQATSDLQTLKITKDLFFRMVTDFPEMGVEIMRVLAHRLDATNAQLRAAR